MKYLIFAYALLMIQPDAVAQYLWRPETRPQKQQYAPNIQPGKRPAAKATAVGVRLASQVHLIHTSGEFAVMDSATMSYSGTKGGRVSAPNEAWEWDYDESRTYSWFTAAPDGSLSGKGIKVFDAAGDLISYTSYSYDHFDDSFMYSYSNHFTYDADHRCLTALYRVLDMTGTPANHMRSNYVYAATGNSYTLIREAWDVVAMAWNQIDRYAYIYNAAGQLVQYEQDMRTDTGWRHDFIVTYTYNDSGNKVIDLIYAMNDATNNMDLVAKTLYSKFAAGKPQEVLEQYWSTLSMSFVDDTRSFYSYNKYGLMEAYYTEQWNMMGWESTTGDVAGRWHYEEYAREAGPADIAENSMELYPVPAAREATLIINWAEAQAATISVIDMQGRTWNTTAVPATKHYKGMIPVNDLPEGVYVVVVRGEKSKFLRKLSVAR